MSGGNAGQGSLPNEAMNVVRNHGVQHCNRATTGEDGIGIGINNWGCWNRHHSSQAVQETVTSTRIIQPTSKTAASAAPSRRTSILSKSESTLSTPARVSTRLPLSTLTSSLKPASISSTIKSVIPLSQTSKLASTTNAIPPTSSSSLTPLTTTPPFLTALPITAPYPTTLSAFFPAQPKETSNGNADTLPEGLGPVPIAVQNSSQGAGIIAGILLGVIALAGVLVVLLFKRYKRGRSIGSLSLNGNWYGRDDDMAPILGGSGRGSEKGGGRNLTGSRSLRTRNKNYSRKGGRTETNLATPYNTAGVEMSGEAGGVMDSYPYPVDHVPGLGMGMGMGRAVTLPAPAFAPLRANRSSSVYSGSILNAFPAGASFTPEIPARNPKRGMSMSLNFGFNDRDDFGTADVKRSTSELYRRADRGIGDGGLRSGLGLGLSEAIVEKSEQRPRTIEDFRRSRNLGESMRRGRPNYDVGTPDFEEEKESVGGRAYGSGVRDSEGMEVRVYHERERENSQTGILRIGLRGSELEKSKSKYGGGEWKDSGLGRETWYGEDDKKVKRDSGKSVGGASAASHGYVGYNGAGYGGLGYGGLGYGSGGGGGGGEYQKEVVLNVDALSVFTQEEEEEEEERYEAMRRGYKGRVRFGMGVQRRHSREGGPDRWV